MNKLPDIEQFVLDGVSASIHIVGAAREFSHVVFGIEGVAQYFKRQLASLEGLLYEYRNRYRHIHAHTFEKTLTVGLELVI
jgi:hypothetical protein